MINFKKSYLQTYTGDPQFFYDLVSGKGPTCVEFFWKELIGALICDLDALNREKTQFSLTPFCPSFPKIDNRLFFGIIVNYDNDFKINSLFV